MAFLKEDDDHLQSQTQSETFMVGYIVAYIVGLQYYSGRIGGREIIGLIREPLNHSDPNAIKAENSRNDKVGYIERKVASVLAPLIDSKIVHIEGILPIMGKNEFKYKILCHVRVFSKIESFESVKSAFSRSGLCLFSQNVDLGENFKLVDENLCKTVVNGVMEPPKDWILPDLFVHQKEGLYWLYNRENSDELPPFWVASGEGFVNVLTGYHTDKRPEPFRGGIFADEMGLGKTLTLVSLIAFDRGTEVNDGMNDEAIEVETEPLVISSCKRNRKGQVINSAIVSTKLNVSPKMTLVVCPPSVFSTWITQLTEHTMHGIIKAYVYYGKRTQDVSELEKYDLVLTTYSTLVSGLKSADDPINKIEWWRVILDEAHIIKNHKSKLSSAVTRINAKRRWVVTGTPIQNGSMDLFSIMAFLRFDPFCTKSYWDNLVQQPISQGYAKGLSRLQALMATISLRRTKEKTLIGLPPKAIHTCNVELSPDERKLYDEMETKAKNFVEGYIARGSVTRNYSTVLSMILRLRQICTHTELCPPEVRASLSSYNFEDASNNPELLNKLVILLQDSEDIDCPICLSPPSKMIITSCAHIFCETCILRTIKQSKASCPLCRRQLSESDLFSPPPEYTTDVNTSCTKASSKVAALLKLLEATRNENPSIKSVIFSQFQKLLLLLEEPLKQAGFKTLRFDGAMSAKKRTNVIKEFGVPGPDGPTVLLASLRASGTGINLTAASRVYLMEPWWNSAVEEQAMDRVHRIGQKEDVKVVKMVAKDSIDERILLLQEKKQTLPKEAFRKKGKDEKREIDLADLRTLMSL